MYGRNWTNCVLCGAMDREKFVSQACVRNTKTWGYPVKLIECRFSTNKSKYTAGTLWNLLQQDLVVDKCMRVFQ